MSQDIESDWTVPSPRCPHLDEVDEKKLRQLFSKVAAIRSADRELFEFTHRPIEVFRSPQGTQKEEQVVGEEAVYREFSENRIGNFSVVIEGEVGTGKSELCAYLAHRLGGDPDSGGDGRPILHVDKDDDLMTLLSDRIPDFYEKHFDEELPGASNFRQLRKDLKKNPTVVANNATSGAMLNLSSLDYDIQVDGNDEKISEFVQDQLSLLVEKGEYAKEIKFITEAAYRQNDFLQVIKDDVSAAEAVASFNEELWRVIRDRYQTASLDDVLEQVGQRFTDTRPVIIFEDFAITAMEGTRLRNYMERDKESDNWDFVVAGTRDSTQVLHTQTAEDRFEFYRTNKQNSNSVLFLDEDSAVDFIRPYLGYFKTFDDVAPSVTYDRSGEGLQLELNPAPEGSICGQCGFCDESFRDLFPLTEEFVHRMYTGLREDEQSPREYVMAVFEVLNDYYEGHISIPSDAPRLSSLTNHVDPSTDIYENEESLARMARWYGKPSSGKIEIDRRFVEAFGLLQPVKELESVELTTDTVTVPTDSHSPPPTPPKNPDKPSVSDPEPEVSKAQRLIGDLQPNVQPWQKSPSNFPEITRYLRSGLRSVIENLTNGFELYEGMGLQYNLSSQKDPFVFSSLKQRPGDDQIIIDPEEFRISDLKTLLKFGIYREEQSRNAEYDEVYKAIGTQLTGYARRWRELIKENNIQSEMCLFKQSSSNYDLADFALAGYAQVVMLDSPFTEITAESLSRRFEDSTPYKIDSELRRELDDELSPDELTDLTEFIKDGEWYEKMVRSLFGATQTTLDLARIRSRLNRNPPYDVLSALGRQYIGRISTRVRFDTNNKFRDIANQAYDFQSVLKSLQNEFRGDAVQVFQMELNAVDLAGVSQTVSTLQTYDNADTDMIESLKKFTRLNQSAIDEAVEAAEFAANRRSGQPRDRIQGVLISMKLASSNIIDRYNEVSVVGVGSTSEFAEEFLSVGAHYVD